MCYWWIYGDAFLKIRVSYHAEKRMRERMGLNKKSIERIAQRAYETGVRHCDCKGNLRKYISHVWENNKNANNIRIYSDKVFVFCDDLLITVFHLPRDLVREKEYLVKNGGGKK